MDGMKKRMIEKRLAFLTKKNDGVLTPDDVLSEASNPKSPLHDQFTWDDTAAAHQWRLSQARELIRSVRIEFKVDSRNVSTVRYVRDPDAGEKQGYSDVTKLRTSKDLSRAALAAELEQVKGRMDRARSLAEVFGMEGEVDDFVRNLEVMHDRLNKAA